MEHCQNCGSELKKNAKFCTSCGEVVPEPVHIQEEIKPEKRSKEKAPNKQKRIFLFFFVPVILLTLLVFGGYAYGDYVTNPERQISNFEEAVKSKSVDELTPLISTHFPSMKLGNAEISQMIDFLQKNPGELNALVEQFKQEVKDQSLANGDGWIHLKKDGKQLLIFDKFTFELQPVFLLVSSNFTNTQIDINGEEGGVFRNEQSPVKIGPLTPGEHVVNGAYNGPYGEYEKEVTVNTYDFGLADVPLQITFDGHYVTLNSNLKQSTLYVNGVDTYQTLGETGQYGPITMDGSMTFQAGYEYPWGFAVSDVVTVDSPDITEITLNIDPVNDFLQDSLMYSIDHHVMEWIDAYTYMDTSYFSYMLNEDYLRKTQENFDTMYEDDFRFQGTVEKVVYDLDSVTVEELPNGTYEAKILAELTFDSGYYPLGQDPADHPTELTSYVWEYTLEYYEYTNDWYITDSIEVDELSSSNLVEHPFR
ncbi:putative membrane protein YvbJ [Salirhabdus euzebyi]|uniref:Putative membrane protein YvbJ n=1 Tax=Salirhabdus euzebyi TaxID=394506 RepID=A0A841Q3U3_9BACI|nr:zinc-ribbon domain-containing protein [Salirhabdus euzebyi]MBB6453081.1 putative membrane protein YvbJ [Salirhabdus euzebyi]